MKNKKAIAAVLLVFGLIGKTAEAVRVRGVQSCGVWVKERVAKTASFEEAWLLGYLSGIAIATNKDILKGTDNDSIDLWMDNYCKANPLKDLSDGGQTLFFELMKQKGL